MGMPGPLGAGLQKDPRGREGALGRLPVLTAWAPDQGPRVRRGAGGGPDPSGQLDTMSR